MKSPQKWEKRSKKAPNIAQKLFLFSRGGGATAYSCGRPCLQSRGFNNHYFLYKKWILIKKYAPKRTKLHHSKKIFRVSMPPNPLANAWLRHASQAPPPHPQKKIVGPSWQILHTTMNYYWEIYLRIHPGRQLIVCSTLYVYALQNLFRGQKMTKIVAQHILKCITWAVFSNTKCP